MSETADKINETREDPGYIPISKDFDSLPPLNMKPSPSEIGKLEKIEVQY